MSAREEALNAVKAEDFIFGRNAGGEGRLLFVESADQNSISVRHVPSMARAVLGRDGISRWCENGGTCTLISTATLPPVAYAVALGHYRKRQQASAGADQGLTKPEIELILNGGEFFTSRPLPD